MALSSHNYKIYFITAVFRSLVDHYFFLSFFFFYVSYCIFPIDYLSSIDFHVLLVSVLVENDFCLLEINLHLHKYSMYLQARGKKKKSRLF